MSVCYNKGRNLTALASKMIGVFTGRTSYCPKSVFRISLFPWSESTVRIGLSVSILRFYFNTCQFYYICISDQKKKMLYKLMNISVCFPSTISNDFTITSTRFLRAGKGNVSVAFSVFSHILKIFIMSATSNNSSRSPAHNLTLIMRTWLSRGNG